MKKLLAIIVAVFLTACTSSQVRDITESGMIIAGKDPEKARKVGAAAGQFAGGLSDITVEDEIEIGRSIAIQIMAQKGGLYPNSEIQDYVTKVGKAVARNSERPNLPYYFAVVNDEEPNAWATPGGYVFITVGTLRALESEAELAGVLAHEVAHIQRGHMLQVLQRGQVQTGILDTLKATDSDYEEYSTAVQDATKVILEGGLPREMEYEADKVGAEIAALTGYDPAALGNFLSGLQEEAPQSGGWLSSTHPPSRDRAQALDRQLATDLAGIGGATQEQRFNRIVKAGMN